MQSVYALKEAFGAVANELDVAHDELTKLAADPTAPIEDVTTAQERFSQIQTRADILAQQIEREELAAQKALEQEFHKSEDTDGAKIRNTAAFWRAVADKTDPRTVVDADFYGIPSGHDSSAASLLPVSLSNTLVSDPLATNPIRSRCRVTNIGGLEVPVLGWTLTDTTMLDDSNTATLATMAGSVITFARYKTKVGTTASDTVVHGTDTNLVTEINDKLLAALVAKEKLRMFTEASAAAEKHMSFYQKPSDYTITDVSGAGMFEAVTNALADLDDEYQDNAAVCMKRSDYVGMLREIAGDASLFAAPPESVIGAPVTFCSSATIPVVGDFSYCQINYDGAPVVDADKEIMQGLYRFVVTAWFDIWRLTDNAFRLAIDTSS